MKKIFYCITFFFFILTCQAQIGMGEWKIFSTFYEPSKIIETPELIYFISDGYLYSYDKNYDEYKEYNTQNLLNDNNVINIEYNKKNNILVIIYENSNIDLLVNNKIYNIPYIKNATFNTSKSINDINFYQDDILLSTDYGITILNAKKKEIKITYNLGIKILSSCIFNNTIYVGREDNIYIGNLNDNLLEYKNWKFYKDQKLKKLLSNDVGILMHDINNSLYKMDSNENYSYIGNFSNIKKTLNEDFIFFNHDMYAYANKDLNITEYLRYETYESLKNKDIKDITIYNNNLCFLFSEGICFFQKKGDILTQTKEINCTDNSTIKIPYNLYFHNNKLYVNNPGINEYNRTDQFTSSNISILENNHWSLIKANEFPTFYHPEISLCALSNIVVDPDNDNILYFGSWLEGLYRVKDNKFDAHFGNENISFITNADNWASKIAALTFDKDKNLWMTHHSLNTGLLVMKRDGKWVNYDYPELKDKQHLDRMLIPEKSKTKWILFTYRYNNMVFAFNDNETIDNLSDDITRKFTSFVDQDDKQISASQFFCITEDKKGQLWIGTDQGPIILTNPDNFNNSNFKCTRVKIPRNDGTNDADLLLSDESILCITIDGANRKWIGTKESGVYLVSKDGLETIHHFTTQNSPLPSNMVFNIVINPETGEVYFGTENGLAAFRWDSGEGKKDFSNVYAFPNPVRPDFEGWITITGLQENSLVKITDISGNQIYQNYSHGGQILWNGRNKNGDRVKTGIYLVYASNEEGKEGVVTKIMVVN